VLNTTQKQFFFTAPATNSKFISVQLIKRKILAMGLLGLICCGSLQAASELVPTQLLCEYLTNPLGIDEPKPRLSWQCSAIDPTSRGLTQDSYQVVVASSPEMLAKDQGDLWDSGKVVSGQSIHVPYAGKPLVSLQRCFWKVRVWTPKGEAWSEPSVWTMGFLKEEEWNAKWIGATSRSTAFLEGAEWIWTPEKEAGIFYPPGERYFRWNVTLPVAAKIDKAMVFMTADNSFVLYVNGKRAGGGDNYGVVQLIDVTSYLSSGRNVLAIKATNGGTVTNAAGLIGKLEIRLADGKSITSTLDAGVLTATEKQNGWERAAFDDSSWKPARTLGAFGMAPWGKPTVLGDPLPLLRREFTVSKSAKHATAYIAGLGFHELRINGAKVGNHELEPGWTNYRKACEYTAYDVTPLLKEGSNVLGVMLGNGMYNVTGGRYTKFKGSFGDLKFILHLRVEYADGTTDSVISDESWRSTPGPVVFSCIYGGEDYDARKEIPGWDKPGLKDSNWTPVVVLASPGGKLTTRSAPPITIKEEFRPVKITQPRPGVFVYDLGQNFSGWPALSVSGPAGTSVKMITGEAIDTNGLVSQRSSGSPVWFSYTLKGTGTEVWHPRFSYSGFRYVQMEGAVPEGETTAAPDKPRVQQIVGQFLYLDTAVEGEFASSNPQVNDIHALILAAIKSNFKSVMTDCPHREKLGWLECSHLLAGCFMYNYDCARFYEKIAGDMRDAQLDNGMVPDIAPEYPVFPGGFRDSPEWGSACVIAPWRAYRMYGDARILQDNYDAMKRYVAYLGSTAKNNIVSHGLGDWCDVGPKGPGVSQLTSLGLTATGVYYQDIDILRQIAGLLGKGEDAIAYNKLAEEVKASFTAAFFHSETNQYDRNSQTGNAMPLFLGLVAPDRRVAVLDNLARDVRASGNRITAGDVGFYYVVQAFLNGGRSDVLYDMLLQTNGPGYLYQIKQGATSLPETWDANPGSSLNHCMLGHIEEWFYSGLLGISMDAPGFRRIIIKPQPVGDLTWAKGHYDSLYGRIKSSWRHVGDKLTMEIAIPPNTTSIVYVPARDATKITESGKSASVVSGIKLLRYENGAAIFEIGSGAYRFESADMGVSKN
jgi:alpha-L-rhamnosidase